ncbi:hypothetical protein BT63DRAFT_426199 [Microthyrium microscopicum]|uniref:t-SNARE coiled-coil homology domain-containing protein n=1 Tax=Microthyrium microscopicum TaxID=703497 RepID=A0A6A6U797_9PEZI|nr:hypothetical protein BT63DRAFT_426199 [Microthyrium microscopicum]
MATTSPSQLLLLADHIKLSLLERRRALALSLPSSTDPSISRSLDTLDAGISALVRAGSVDAATLSSLREQYAALNAQFTGNAKSSYNDAGSSSKVLGKANDSALDEDFRAAQHVGGKSVRFTDEDEDGAGGSQAPYRDESEDEGVDQTGLSNEQIHAYHKNVLAEQDSQLENLGSSIGRQRELTIAIGNELDDHVLLLEDVDGAVDRHQGQLDGAARRLGRVAQRARENWSMWVILGLILILVMLIVITK